MEDVFFGFLILLLGLIMGIAFGSWVGRAELREDFRRGDFTNLK